MWKPGHSGLWFSHSSSKCKCYHLIMHTFKTRVSLPSLLPTYTLSEQPLDNDVSVQYICTIFSLSRPNNNVYTTTLPGSDGHTLKGRWQRHTMKIKSNTSPSAHSACTMRSFPCLPVNQELSLPLLFPRAE